MSLTEKEIEKAKKERDIWNKKAAYWHNAIPNFNYNVRGSLTEDVKIALTFEQLELNKSLSKGINWNNRVNIIIGMINLVLFIFNIILILTNYF